MHLSDQCSSSLSYSSSKVIIKKNRTNFYFGSGPIKASFSFTKENISFNELNISSTQFHTGPLDTKFWQFVLFRTLLHWVTGAQLLTVFLFDETNVIDFLANNVSL